MEFEPLKEELEEALLPIVEAARDTGWAEGVDFTTPEYRELKQLGMFESVREYYDMTAAVKPTYAAMKYFERKEKRQARHAVDAAKSIGGKILDKGADIAASIIAKQIGI